ncbi:D-cysteine desulfhydrase family protein (plasmid) [Aliisedimentitalea scapharcae]|uniref:D-cysteine desulfhydrase family protein n=1 Tax=Aliisedimentitalea scapharcae TaxID=1524259 RepID=A0ABZ2XZE9_9RHOB
MTQRFSDLVSRLPVLSKFSRLPLYDTPTPLQAMANSSRNLGVKIDIKRDDLLPLAMGGNKVRQLEFYLGQAKANGSDTVLITGAVQSNFVRLCAAAARTQGWHPIVQLEDRVPNTDSHYASSGNVLLLQLLGAEIIRYPMGEDEAGADANLDVIADRLRQNGKRPYVIHLGLDHAPLGALGYVAAAVETRLQYQVRGIDPDHVVVASGSGLTHVGFLAGARAIGWNVNVLGVCVRRSASLQIKRIKQRAMETFRLLDSDYQLKSSDIDVCDAVLAPGYGQMNKPVSDAITLAARQDAILLDPVYTGRGFAGLLHHVQTGRIRPGDRVCFLHTGGTPGIFAYGDQTIAD